MKKRLFFSLVFFVKVALATVLPLVVFAIPGVILDRRLSSTPSLTVITIVLAIATTGLIIRRLARKEVKRMNRI